MLRILVLALVLMVAVVALVPRRSVPEPLAATEWPETRALPATMFVDHNGEEFPSAQLTERFTLMFFGFTNCPDVCPLSMAVLAQAMDQLRATRTPPPRVVLVSVDPARDTPEQLRNYLAVFDSEFIGLTADESELERLRPPNKFQFSQDPDGDPLIPDPVARMLDRAYVKGQKENELETDEPED